MRMTDEKIDYRFKMLYAISMVMVVAGHVTYEGGVSLFSNWFPYYGFHLALFMFCSGYFYNPYVETDIFQYLLKNIRKLIIPLYIYNFIYGLISELLILKGFTFSYPLNFYNLFISPLINGHAFALNLGGWFIAPLFMVKIFSVILFKLLKKIKLYKYQFLICIILGAVGISLANYGYNQNLWLALTRFLYFIPFYSLGVYYKNVLEIKTSKIPNIYYFGFILFIQLTICCIYKTTPAYSQAWMQGFNSNPFVPILVGFIGIAFWMRIVIILEPVLGHSKYINLIANNTFSIMMNQFIGFMFIKVIYAVLCKLKIAFFDFDWILFKSEKMYYYLPENISWLSILYVIAGIAIPILIQYGIDYVKLTLCSKFLQKKIMK